MINYGGGTHFHGAVRPFGSVIDEVSGHFFQVLGFAAKFQPRGHRHVDLNALVLIDAHDGAAKCRQHRFNFGGRANGLGPSGAPCPVKIETHLVAHDPGLLGNLAGKIRFAVLGFIGENAQGRFQGVSKIANLRAGAVNDFRVGVNKQVQFIRHGLHFGRKFPFQALGLAATDGAQGLLHALHGLEGNAHLQQD